MYAAQIEQPTQTTAMIGMSTQPIGTVCPLVVFFNTMKIL